MTKKNPEYETGWHSTGTLDVLPSVGQVVKRLEANPDVALHGRNFSESLEGWWTYDAVWNTPDGARVHGRLNIHNTKPGDSDRPEKRSLDPEAYDPEVKPLKGYFHAYADADRPWDPSWPSPLNVFLERKIRPGYATLDYGQINSLDVEKTKNLPGLLASLSELQWTAVVFTHDDLTVRDLLRSGTDFDMPLISRLPASMYGRVFDMRVIREPSRMLLNKWLKRYGTQLPRGGAAILLSSGRRKGFQACELTFPMTPKFTDGGDISPLVAALEKMMRNQAMEVDGDAIEELRKEWALLTGTERLRRTTEAMNAASEKIKELESLVASLRDALKTSQGFNEKFKANGENLVKEIRGHRQREEEAKKEQKRLRGELDRLLRMIRDSNLGEAVAAREAAEEDVRIADELLDEQNHELTGLRRKNARLRGELARLGGDFTFLSTPAEEASAPSSWDEFFQRVPSLEFVVLGDVESGVDKLRRQVQEENWLNRSWGALCALDEFARLKKERGAEELPHFRAYLADPLARHVIPRTRYTGAESKSVMANNKFVAARTFPVPRQVDPSGMVVMESHIRIGSGKPPAPRLHFHDDTNGATGKIHVGHLGPHLPNYRTN